MVRNLLAFLSKTLNWSQTMENRVMEQETNVSTTPRQARSKYLTRAECKIIDQTIQAAFDNGTLRSDEEMARIIHLPNVKVTPIHVFRSRVQRLRIMQKRGSDGEMSGFKQKYARKPKPVTADSRCAQGNGAKPVSLMQIATLLAQASKGLQEFVDQQKAHYSV